MQPRVTVHRPKRRRIPLELAPLAVVAGIFIVLLLTGTDYRSFRKEHGHHHGAPHGGTLIVLGAHTAHLELLLDPGEGRLTVYLLDADAAHPYALRGEEMIWQIRRSAKDPWTPLVMKAVDDPEVGPVPGLANKFEGCLHLLRGATGFEFRTPRLHLAGQDYPAVTSRYPEGNHGSREILDRRSFEPSPAP